MKAIKLLIGLICILNLSHVFAGLEQFSNRVEPLALNATVELFDDKYIEMSINPYWVNDFTNYRVDNYVRLGINPRTLDGLLANNVGTVQLQINYDTWDNVNGVFMLNTIYKTLSTDYSTNPNDLIEDQATYIFEGAHRIDVRVITATPGLDLSFLYVEIGIEVERYYSLTQNSVVNLNHRGSGSLSTNVLQQDEFIEFHWPYHYGAESYELEWVHINDYDLDLTTDPIDLSYFSTSSLSYSYYLNSTRIEISNNFYEIPNIFDHGYVIYRVRPIYKDGSNYELRIEGEWSAAESGFVSNHPTANIIPVTWEFDPEMNWSHSVSYAEEGKRFEGMSFSDGLGKVHQSVSSNPETDQVIVNNVYYDELGTPVISDLPTPKDQANMEHFNSFNLVFGTTIPYSENYFDPTPTGGNCDLNSVGMDPSTGAGRYYSPANPDQDGENAFIPDAETFPFSRITFRDDFSGRVDRISAAGSELAMGQQRETRIVYASPTQTELNQMFGVEVGWASHYQKTFTIDPNGQIYVKYTDMSGRVVATYMQGEEPVNVLELDDPGVVDTYTKPLLVNGNVQNVEMNPPVAQFTFTEFFTENSAEYTVDYAFTPQQYQDLCMLAPACFDCVYDLQIQIVHECGEVIYNSLPLTINGGTLDEICSPSAPYTFQELVTIPKGVYTITKTLSVNQEVIDEYYCMYLENQDPNASECVPTIGDIFNPLYEAEEFIECEPEPLVPSLTPSDCEIKIIQMLSDVSPGGQYGLYVAGSGGYSTGDATCVLPIAYTAPLSFPVPGAPNFVPTDLEDLITNWQEDWAEILLPYHPEYCFIASGGWCDQLVSSNAYDESMLAINTYDDACAAGFMEPLGSLSGMPTYVSCGTPLLDPFFSGGPGSSFMTDAQNGIFSGLDLITPGLMNYIQIDGANYNLWEYVMAHIIDPDADTQAEMEAAILGFVFMNPDCPNDCPSCDEDLFWITFRKLYLAMKANYLQLAMDQFAASLACTGMPEIGLPTSGIYEDKIPAFPSAAFIQFYINTIVTNNGGGGAPNINNQGQTVGAIQTMTVAQCETSCDNYVEEWIQSLSSCEDNGTYLTQLPQVTLDALKADLKDLCMTGCAESLPFPVSIPVGGTPPTVDDILISYGFDLSTTCSQWLIAEPGSYENTMDFVNSINGNRLDTCSCNALLQAQEDLASYPVGTTVEEVLFINTGVLYEDANAYICQCEHVLEGKGGWYPGFVWNETENNWLLSTPYVVPPGISCDVCYDCEDVDAMLSTLVTNFGYTTGSTLEENLAAFNQAQNAGSILRNYLNDQMNFDYSTGFYTDFIAQCHADPSDPYCEINPLAQQFIEMLNLMAHREQLTSGSQLDLALESIVYPNSQLPEEGIHQYYSALESGTTLTMNLADGISQSCNVTMTLPAGATFEFENILSISGVYPSSYECEDNNTFETEVSYLDCGVLTSTFVTVYTTCFEANECSCGDPAPLCGDNEPEVWHPCYQPRLDELYIEAEDLLESALQEQYIQFVANFNLQCSGAFDTENLSYTGPDRRYQYTLFYYDQSGSLIRTVAPEGVNLLSVSNDAAINAARTTPSTLPVVGVTIPDHSFKTEYKFNSFNQFVETTNPDQEGATKYWYDYYGRIVASQNPVQAADNLYSYTLYDAQGRPEQVGQVQQIAPLVTGQDDLGAAFLAWVAAGTRTEITKTRYDRPVSAGIEALFSNGEQENLRLRVASVYYHPTHNVGIQSWLGYESAIHYSYDIHGNVKEQIQDVPMLSPVDQDIKTTQYEYELISGNVENVKYQPGELDQMTHSYVYDQINRLEEVFTSTDGVHQTREAHYHYFDYGPLARVEIGKDKVQSMDYAYTINGWLKAMNGGRLGSSYDMGKDGATGYLASNTEIHNYSVPDVLAYNLGYFENDYGAISNFQMEASYATYPFEAASPNLYNGNIRHYVTEIFGMNRMGSAYRYDQLNRLKSMTAFFNNNTSYDWQNVLASNDYANSYTYDRNGNIENLTRRAYGANGAMDNMDYQYYSLGAGPSNRLSHVVENQTVNVWNDDITPMGTNNYSYDELGQLLSDPAEGIQNMVWRKGDKKLKKIERDNTLGADMEDVEFVYNPMGIRVLKIVKPRTAGVPSSPDEWTYTYYTYDANGQTMAVYDVTMSTEQNEAILAEQHIYGASRIGMRKYNELIYDDGPLPPPSTSMLGMHSNWAGERRYEINNYLGNVNALLTDRKLATGATPNLFEAVVTMTSDYYPFGMQMPGRHTQSEDYRYAYNGMEVDNEVSGNGNSYTTEFRQYDPRLGRWKSLDPLMAQFPWMSPYVAFNNNPIYFVDPFGLEGTEPTEADKKKGTWTHDNGTVRTYDKELDQWYLADMKVTGQHKRIEGFKVNSYYRLGANGWEESGLMYLDAVSGKDLGTYYTALKFFQRAVNEKAKYHAAERVKKEEYNAAVQEYNKNQNLFYIMYKVSMLGSAVDVYAEVSDGNYAAAGIIAILELAPGELDDAYKATRKTTDSHHLVTNQAAKKYGLKYIPGYKQNGSSNMIELPKPFHGNHPQYNRYVDAKIQSLIKNGNLNAGNLAKIQSQLRSFINSLPKTAADKNLNDVFRDK